MKPEEQKQNLISKYLRDALTPKDMAIFKKHLENEEFRKELIGDARIVEILEEKEDAEVRDMLKNLGSPSADTPDNQHTQNNKSLTKYLVLAACLIGALIALSYFMFSDSDLEPAHFAEYYQKIPVDELNRGTADNSDLSFNEAMSFYANGNYVQSIEKLNASDASNEKITLYKAANHLEMKAYKKAKNQLQKIINSTDREMRQTAEWYLLLVSLELGEKDQIKSLISKLETQSDHIFYNKLLKLKDDMDI